NYRYSLEELAGDEQEAIDRDAATAHDSFDNPRMGENLELDDLGISTGMPKPVPISGDDVRFVIHEDELGFGSDDDDEDEHHRQIKPAAQG
ncbi:hypothetical protein IWW57_002337, partial [Coemansia sp. S610]